MRVNILTASVEFDSDKEMHDFYAKNMDFTDKFFSDNLNELVSDKNKMTLLQKRTTGEGVELVYSVEEG